MKRILSKKTMVSLAMMCILCFAFIPIQAAFATTTMLYGIDEMDDLDSLAKINFDSYGGQFSTFDRTGGNNDGFYSKNFLYIDSHGDYVMCDLKGPGVINRIWFTGAFDRDDNYVKVYFDGETTPTINCTFDDFFEGYSGQFPEPITVIGEDSAGGEISYYPLPFEESIIITVTGISTASPSAPGLFYQVDYEMFPAGTSITSYDPQDSISSVVTKWQNVGTDPKSAAGNTTTSGTINVSADQSYTLYDSTGAKQISSIKLEIPNVPGDSNNGYGRDALNDLWIRIYWDNETTPSVDLPLAAFFGIGDLGLENDANSLMFGIDNADVLYNYFPMPFESNAEIELYSTNSFAVNGVDYEIRSKSFTGDFDEYGYFKTEYTYTHVTKDDPFDVTVLDVEGSGKFVGIHQSMIGPGTEPTYEEGDVRIFVDKSRSPSYFGSGLEDFYNGAAYFVNYDVEETDPLRFGWGFYSNPVTGYTSREDDNFDPNVSVYRLMLHDDITFRDGIRVSVEHGGGANSSGYYGPVSADYYNTAFYYHIPTKKLEVTDTLDVGNSTDETAHSYSIDSQQWSGSLTDTFEGDMDKVALTETGRSHDNYSTFTVDIDCDNEGVVLRRLYDQSGTSQSADVYVDDVKVGTWYRPGENTTHKFREDDYAISSEYTENKSSIAIKIDSSGSQSDWSEYEYTVLSRVDSFASEKDIVSGYTYEIEAKCSSLVLDVTNESPLAGAIIQQYGANNTKAQAWRLVESNDGYYAIVNSISGKVLDVVNGSNQDGAQIQQYTWSGNDYQLWDIEYRGNGYYSIISKGSGKALDIPYGSTSVTDIQQYTYSGSDAQLFELNLIEEPTAEVSISSGGTYKIYNENYYLAMDIADASTQDGALVQQYYANNTNAQEFVITSVGDDYYKIVNGNSGKAVGVVNNSNSNGTSIEQRTYTGATGQQWRFNAIRNGYFALIPRCAETENRVLDVPYASDLPANLQIYDLNATAAQLWRLEIVN